MTETAMQLPNLNDAAEKLRDQIRSAFVELLTPEQWHAMVRAELDKFTKPSTTRDNYGSRTVEVPSVLHTLCVDVFKTHVKAELNALLSNTDNNVGGVYTGDGYRNLLSKIVKDWLTENAAQLVVTTIQALAGEAAQRLILSMQVR